MRYIDLMDGRIMDSHGRRIAVRYFRIAVRAVQQQRRAVLTGIEGSLDLVVALVVAAHEAELDQVFAGFDFCIDDFEAILSRRAKRFLAEDALASLDGHKQCFFVGKARRDDEDGIDGRIVDEVGFALVLLAVRAGDSSTLLDECVHHIRNGDNLCTLRAIRQTINVASAHTTATNDTYM